MLLVLAGATASDETGECWPAIGTIATEAAVKERSVQVRAPLPHRAWRDSGSTCTARPGAGAVSIAPTSTA